MKIEIKEINNPYKFYNEVYGITKMYLKKLYNNPYRKLIPLTVIYLWYCSFCVLGFIYLLLFMSMIRFSNIMLIYIGIVFMCFIIGLANLIRSKRVIKTLVDRKVDSIILINKDKVLMENNIIGQKNELLWSDINYILIGKYSIGFMPKKESDKQVAIYCSINYKEKIYNALEKYEKQELLKEKQ